MVKGAHLASATMPWHWLFFCPALKVRAYFGCPVTKNLDSLKWHWLIFVPMGALSNIVKGQANSHIKATGRTLSVGFIFS